MAFWKRRTTEITDRAEAPARSIDLADRINGAQERFCGLDLNLFPAGQNWHLVLQPGRTPAQLLSSEAALLLSQCRSFRTLRDHVAAIAPVFGLSPKGMKGAYMQSANLHFSQLIEQGLIISETDLFERCKLLPAPSEAMPPISTVGVVTRDRPESLRRCVESYVENTRTHGRKIRFVIADASTGAAAGQNQEMLRQLGNRFDVAVAYAGEEQKRIYAESLLKCGAVSPEVIEFALFDPEGYGYMPGANRNALMLETIGEMFFSTDDDIVCRLATAIPRHNEDDDIYDTTGEADRMNLWFFPDRETALQHAKFVDEDFLTLHDQMLGRSVASCVAAAGDIDLLHLEKLGPRDLRHIINGTGRVAVTLNGRLGHSGSRIPHVFRALNRQSRERLIESEAGYLAARFTREVLRLVSAPSVTRRTWFLSAALAYDHRQLMPPFLPVARGEDGVFADALKICFEDTFLADLPLALLHAPLDDRHYTAEQVWEAAAALPTGYILSACIMSFRPRQGMADGAAKLRALGDYLVDLGSMSLDDFEDFVRLCVWQLQSLYVAEVESETLAYAEPADFWVADVEKYLEMVRSALKRPEYVIPFDTRPGSSQDEARNASRRLVSKFGELLRAWPDVIEAAKDLRAKGHRLAIELH